MTLPPSGRAPTLQGPRVLLRSATPADRQARLALGRDPEFHRLVGGEPSRASLPLTEADVDRWYAEVTAEPLHWVMEVDGRMVGSARLHSLDARNRRARYGVGILSPEHRGKGYGTEATRLVLRYAFRELRLHRVELRVLEFNQRAIATYERCGFVREGVEREGTRIAGAWLSDLMMSILEHEYRDGPLPGDDPRNLRQP